MSDITDYLTSIENRIDSINTCEILQEVSDTIQDELQAILDDLASQSEALTLQVVVPTDLATAIIWIKAQIDATTKPILETIAEIALISTKITSIMTKLTNKIDTLGCSFPPPSI